MDPDICLVELICNAIDGDRFEMNERIRAICDWLRNGGFAPNADRVIDLVARMTPED